MLRKKLLYLLAAGMIVAVLLTGCNFGNMQVVDTVWYFNEAQIKMPDGTVVKGTVEAWRDYEDSDQLQVIINGKAYLTAAENIVLISNVEEN